MLTVDAALPPGALLPEGAALTETVQRLGGLWWSSERALVARDGAAITRLTPRAGGIPMRPASDNSGDATVTSSGGLDVISGASGVHAGLVSEARVSCNSLGLIVAFCADDPARQTLATADSKTAKSSAVLSVSAHSLTLKDRKFDKGLDVPLVGAGPSLAFVQLSPAQMALSRDGHVFASAPIGDAFAPGPVEILLGCVRERAGLTATLGPHRIADLVALPDTDLRSPDAAMLCAAFRDYLTEIFRRAV